MKIIDNEGELTVDEVVKHLHNSVVEVERPSYLLYMLIKMLSFLQN